MTIIYQGQIFLEKVVTKKDTLILFKGKWIEFIKINEETSTTVPYYLLKSIQE